MPRASGRQVKYHYQDHDTDTVDEQPPVQNTWYEVFDAEDVMLIYVVIQQNNDEAAAKNIEVRWTIDGNVYFITVSLANATNNWILRDHTASAAGTNGLEAFSSRTNATRYANKRGLSFKVEVRITSALGTNQRLRCWAVRETLVET